MRSNRHRKSMNNVSDLFCQFRTHFARLCVSFLSQGNNCNEKTNLSIPLSVLARSGHPVLRFINKSEALLQVSRSPYPSEAFLKPAGVIALLCLLLHSCIPARPLLCVRM